LQRDNRFRATVFVAGQERPAHVPNSGRLAELLLPGAPVALRPASHGSRATPYDLELVQAGAALVCVDARLPPTLIREAWSAGRLPEFAVFTRLRPEVRLGESRLDLLFTSGEGSECWVETKCVTLVQHGLAHFPDAPTERGRRHLRELTARARDGVCAAVAFVVQRDDVRGFGPSDETDPAFGAALRVAREAGVKLLAYRCHVSAGEIALGDRVALEF
jgi:sugar fermentation stimulation protein A